MGRKLDLAARMKNPWFWIGLVSIALTALGVDLRSLVSWPALASCALDVLRNPVQLATAALAVLAVFADPTTPGLCDGAACGGKQAGKAGQ